MNTEIVHPSDVAHALKLTRNRYSNTPDLQPVDQFLLDGILSSGVGGHAQTFCRLSQSLLLILVFWICCSSL